MDRSKRGDVARRILEDDLFKEAAIELDRIYVNVWRNAKTIEAREDAHRYMVLLNRMLTHFKSIATTGEIEKRALKELEGKKFWF